METILKSHLDKYYDSLIEYKHIASRLNTVFLKDLEKYNTADSILHLGSSLVLRDWSGISENGWAYAYPTDSKAYTNKDNYSEFINDLLSKQFCLMYAQSFEGLERFFKNLLFECAEIDEELKTIVEIELKKKNLFFSRKNIPGGNSLLEIINKLFDSFSYQKDILQFDLKDSFFVLSETRHNIIHNNYLLSKSKIFCSTNKKNLFVDLFEYNPINKDEIKVNLDIEKFKKLMDFMCEFTFQILKKSCLKYDLNWKLYKNMDKI